ncbi:MAG TPA: RNA methyltransferase, partial [Isosphaeraceae bacterium]|nr:RNA methyltransferase [Isosphaeraceae bacterium]
EIGQNAGYSGPIREISSESNPSMKLFRDLLGGKGIKKHRQALFSGSRVVSEVLEHHPSRLAGWISTADGPPPPEIVPEGLPWFRLSEPLFREIDVAGTHAPLALVHVPDLEPWTDETDWPDGCSLFVPFQDPENVGAVLRSAAAFGVSRVILLREAANPFHPKSVRAGGSSILTLKLLRGPSITDLQTSQIPLIALSAEGSALDDQPWPDRFGLVVGIEGPGLPDHLRSGPCRRVPIDPKVESLNASTAAAIALYAWTQSRRSLSNS